MRRELWGEKSRGIMSRGVLRAHDNKKLDGK